MRRSGGTRTAHPQEGATRFRSRPPRCAHTASGNSATSLKRQGKYTDVTEIEREVLVSTIRLLSAEHKGTLASAINLALSLFYCSQKTEAEKLLRGTLALDLCRRVLGPTHELAHSVPQNLIASEPGITVRRATRMSYAGFLRRQLAACFTL